MIATSDESYFKVSRTGNLLTVSLKLKEKPIRDIGIVDMNSRIIMMKRERKKHLFKKTNSYGFNEYLIRNAKTFDNVLLSDDDGFYLIPREVIIENNSYLHFKSDGYEKQLFLPLEIIYTHKVDSKEYEVF